MTLCDKYVTEVSILIHPPTPFYLPPLSPTAQFRLVSNYTSGKILKLCSRLMNCMSLLCLWSWQSTIEYLCKHTPKLLLDSEFYKFFFTLHNFIPFHHFFFFFLPSFSRFFQYRKNYTSQFIKRNTSEKI